MGDPVGLVESSAAGLMSKASPVAAVLADAAKLQGANKNGKKSEGSGGSTFFTWFIVLALLGVWTSIAVVYFDLVDYQGVLGKLVEYDADGDGDFDVEDAKVLLDEKPGAAAKRGAKRDSTLTKDMGWTLREALKQQLVIIHERVEAKKLAKLALAEVRKLLAKEEQEKELELGRKEMSLRMKERMAAKLKEEEDIMEMMEAELEKRRQQGAQHPDETSEERHSDKEGKKEGKRESKGEAAKAPSASTKERGRRGGGGGGGGEG